MIVYRIVREKYLENPLSGIGASLSKGFRWNSENTKVGYTSESRALALLEVFVHLNSSEDLPNDRYYVEINIPDTLDVLEVNIDDLPKDWKSNPPTAITQTIGDDFVDFNEAAILKVPSSIVPNEYNYLINPNHPDAKEIRVIKTERVMFDSRLKQDK